jgi:hypothetical protein
VAILLFMPFQLLIIWLSSFWKVIGNLEGYFFFGYFLISGFCLLLVGVSECPKCGNDFFIDVTKTAFLSNPFSGKCLNCGLELKTKKRGNNAKTH